ncbi:LysR family transcriptional regulator [Bordetella tumulicola]|uniref:LysR family transcriptional regulator n=1 Tax=Bordetella tumulicola TaxID=1649133 RepID=UPI0039EE1FDC
MAIPIAMKPVTPIPSLSRDLDPISLRLFVAALEEGSLARAAARENIVPSAVSKRMSELEETLGVLLLERGVKGVQATVAGAALAIHARLLLQGMDRMRQEMAGFATGIRGHIHLAASVAALSGELPAYIQAFRRAHPQIDLSLLEYTTQEAFRAVLEGWADIAVGSDFGHDGLQVFPWGHCELVAVVPSQHLLADYDILDYAQLLPFEQIELNRENGISGVLEKTAREAGVTRRISARVSAHETICMLVARGLGVAVVPRYLQARHSHLDIRFIPLSGPWSSTPICIAVKDLDALSPPVQTLLSHLGIPTPAA